MKAEAACASWSSFILLHPYLRSSRGWSRTSGLRVQSAAFVPAQTTRDHRGQLLAAAGRALRADLPRRGRMARRKLTSRVQCPMQESNLRPNVGMVA
jgi:hypothetical protein